MADNETKAKLIKLLGKVIINSDVTYNNARIINYKGNIESYISGGNYGSALELAQTLRRKNKEDANLDKLIDKLSELKDKKSQAGGKCRKSHRKRKTSSKRKISIKRKTSSNRKTSSRRKKRTSRQ